MLQMLCLSVYLNSDDMASFLKAHFEHLSTGTTSDLALVDQISHLRRVTLPHSKGILLAFLTYTITDYSLCAVL